MTTSNNLAQSTSATNLELARQAFQQGKYEEALMQIYAALWSGVHDPNIHLLLWDVLEAQRLERSRVKLLRKAIEEVAFSRKPKAPLPVIEPDPDPNGKRRAPRFPVSHPVILVANDPRRKLWAELAVVEVTSLVGAQLRVATEFLVGEHVHLFGTRGDAQESIEAVIRNLRPDDEEEGRFLAGVEFLTPAGHWLLPNQNQAETADAS
ncbi:PilZ domain-containing protein [Chloracidobacterium sp. D]|uniref:PilZ domain-containing protein n=1 Tax=Chloracidobacterium sp. D TaxID=2821536 RepID=UPI001B8CA9CE|nr:PilZ domain-containing protein [Chloracidobacterium sp. D]QUV81445.1 PilZ domain-containing protein [Chloracidobacterium sp. D]